MKPEEKSRKDIDQLLSLAGWAVQDVDQINLGASLGVAVREYPTNSGIVDYALFVDRKAVGVIEAKPAGTTLSGVAVQSEGYGHNFPDNVQHFTLPLPFAYESTGVETFFRMSEILLSDQEGCLPSTSQKPCWNGFKRMKPLF